jgi:hypothetical protein
VAVFVAIKGITLSGYYNVNQPTTKLNQKQFKGK